LVSLVGAVATAPPSAHAQMCTPAIKNCEGDANAEAQRCVLQCKRYDDACTDRCDDTHDIVVRYCWIKAALCKTTEESQVIVKAAGQLKSVVASRRVVQPMEPRFCDARRSRHHCASQPPSMPLHLSCQPRLTWRERRSAHFVSRP